MMDVTNAHIRRQLLTALTKLVNDGVEYLGEEQMAGILQELMEELDGKMSRRTCYFSDRGGRPVLTLFYPKAEALEGEMEILTRVCGLVVNVEPKPPRMVEMKVLVQGEGVRDGVELRGRTVQNTTKGAALELFPPDEKQAGELRTLVEKMRASSNIAAQRTGPPPPFPGGRPLHPPPSQDHLVEGPDDFEKRWSISKGNIAAALLEASTVEGYALLEFVTSRITRQLVIHHGKLIDFRRDPPAASESVEKLMASAGKVEADDVLKAQKLASQQYITAGEALVDMQCVTHQELLVALRTRVIFLLRRVWELTEGEVLLYVLERRPPPFLRTSVNLVEQVVCQLRTDIEALSAKERAIREERFSGCRIQRSDPLPMDISRAGLDEQEQRFLEVVLAEDRSLAQLVRTSNLSRPHTLTMLFILDEMGLIERREEIRHLWEHDEIETLGGQVQTGDYFDLFGIHWSAFDAEVEESYQRLCKKLDVPDEVRERAGTKIDKVRREIDAAYEVLSHPARRRAYRDERVDEFAQRSAVQIYEDKADSYRMQSDVQGLIECLRRILELQPKNTKARRDLTALLEMAK